MAEVRVDGSASGLLEFNELSFFYFLDKFLLPVPFFFGNLASSLIKQHHYSHLAGKAARS
jgi:hypothetical protein